MNIKLPTSYYQLTHDEQNKVIARMAELQSVRVALTPVPRYLTSEQQQQVREVATLLLHFPNCISNLLPMLNASMITNRDANRILYLLDIMTNEVASELTVMTRNGDRVILLDQQQSLRRGRPTAGESEQRTKERQQKARAEAISSLTGYRIAQPEAAAVDTSRPTDTSRRKQEPDLFSQAVADATGTATVSEASPSDNLKSLREWSWILPTDLATRVKTLRDLRTQHAAHSERAKLLLEQGAKSAEIAEHTQAAADINEQIADLYAAIDRHLATMFALLSEVNPAYMSHADRYQDRGGIKALLADLRPYYDKVIAADPTVMASAIMARAQKMNDAWVAATTRDPERDKRLHTIKAYFSRKDVAASQQRLDKLRAYRTEAESLRVDADTLAGMDVIIADCESQLA